MLTATRRLYREPLDTLYRAQDNRPGRNTGDDVVVSFDTCTEGFNRGTRI